MTAQSIHSSLSTSSFSSASNNSHDSSSVSENTSSRMEGLYHTSTIQAKFNPRQQCQRLTLKIKKKVTSRHFWMSFLPITSWLPKYNLKTDLVADVISGFTVASMSIPQSMSYALSLANLPAVVGLYMSAFPLIPYAFFGTSRQLAIGGIAIVSFLTGEVVSELTSQYKSSLNTTAIPTQDLQKMLDDHSISVAMSLALLVGIIQILLGALGLGVVANYFSDAFVSGYTCGAGIQVMTTQFKDLLGLQNTKTYSGFFKVPNTIYNVCSLLYTANWYTIVGSVISIIFLLIMKEFVNPKVKKYINFLLPADLFLVVVLTLISYYANFNKNFGIKIVQTVPNGLPTPKLPDVSYWQTFYINAILIGIVAYSINASLAILYAKKHRYDIDVNQELFAYGISNVLCSFIYCYPSAASLARSSVQEQSGCKTEIASLINAVIIIIIIAFLSQLLQPLPIFCLSAVIIVALKHIVFQVKDFFTFCRINKLEAVVWLASFLSVVILDIDIGLVVGLVASFLIVVINDQFIQLRKLDLYGASNYVDANLVKIDYYTRKNEDTSHAMILKMQNSIFYANCMSFLERIYRLYSFKPTSTMPKKEQSLEQHYPNLILDMSAVNYVDTNGVKALEQLIKDFTEINVAVYLCQLQDHVLKMMHRMKLVDTFDKCFQVTIEDALTASKEKKSQFSNVEHI